MNIGIVGHGFVGAAVDYGFPDAVKIIIDPKYGNSIEDLRDKNIEVTFICVPTPMQKDANIDATILIDVTRKAIETTEGLVVIKSTVIPEIIDSLAKLSDRVIYNPEFLTEKASNHDFVNPPMHVFGGCRNQTEKLLQIYEQFSSCAICPVYHVTPVEASFIKYGINSFLASKVLWYNQFHDIIEGYDGNYSTIIEAIGTDSRIGRSHMAVPGPDGRKAFGGSCFVKDSSAFIMFARSIGKDFTVLEEAVRRNQEYRNSYGEPLPREKQMNVRFDYDI